ncbi:hypothetical protein [uncultured Brachybacterium sp.]|uniref:hypothetical protein n=1 Tax=uncultured Brachybacterium sp. TaxID=189680 RepID=UPI0026373913|nr:hypothetical protein [uncultured Brachybacterium sp.]
MALEYGALWRKVSPRVAQRFGDSLLLCHRCFASNEREPKHAVHVKRSSSATLDAHHSVAPRNPGFDDEARLHGTRDEVRRETSIDLGGTAPGLTPTMRYTQSAEPTMKRPDPHRTSGGSFHVEREVELITGRLAQRRTVSVSR